MSLTLPLLLVRVNREDKATYFSLYESSFELLMAAEKGRAAAGGTGTERITCCGLFVLTVKYFIVDPLIPVTQANTCQWTVKLWVATN